MPTDLERFAIKVSFGNCWDWLAAKHKKGYGQFRSGSSMKQAHKWLWERTVGPIPAGLELDHLCKNRACVNPDHLEPVTHAENVARAASSSPGLLAHWARVHEKRTHCSDGHEFTEENTMRYKHKRQCRTCNRAKAKAWRDARNSGFAN